MTTIGSDPSCDVVIADDEISPRHVELRQLADGRLEIEDLDSKSGTWVGGVRLGGPATLEGGERLRIGRTELIVLARAPRTRRERALTRRETVQRLVTRVAAGDCCSPSAAVAIAVIAVVLAAAGVFSGGGGDEADERSRRPRSSISPRPSTAIVVALGGGAARRQRHRAGCSTPRRA